MGAALSSRFAAPYKELQVEQASGAVQLVELQQQQQIEPLNRPSSCPLSTRSFVTRHRLIFIRVLVRVAVVAVIIGLSKVFNYRKAVDEYVTSVVALGHVLSYAAFGGAALLFNTLSPTGYLRCVAALLLDPRLECLADGSAARCLQALLLDGGRFALHASVALCCCCY